MCCVLIFSFTACSNTQNEDSVFVKEATDSYFRLNETSITNPVKFKHDGVSVTLSDILYEDLVTWFSFNLENNTESCVNVLVTDLSVNGIMCQDSMIESVESKNSKNAYFEISNEWFSNSLIETIKEIEFTVRLQDSESFEFASSDVLRALTNTPKKYVQKYNKDGETVYTDDGALIVFKGLSKSKMSDDTELSFYIENNTDSHFSVIANEVYINDTLFMPTFIVSVGGGKKATESILLTKNELIDAKIEKITSVKVSFTAIDKNSNTVFKTKLSDIPVK